MKRNSFVEGTFIATAAVVLVKILGMLYVIPFYHIVGSQGGALYSYAYNIYNIFLSMSSAGLPSAVSKIISEYDTLGYHDAKNRAISIAYKLIGILSIVVFLVLFVFADEIGMLIIHNIEGGNTYQDIAFVVRCVAPAVLVIPFLSVTKGYLQGHKYMSPSSVSQLIEQIVRIVVILLGSYLVLNVFHGTLSLAVGIAVSGAFVGGLAAVIYLRFMIRKHGDELFGKSDKKDLISNKEILKKIVGYALPFVIIAVVNDLYSFTDQYLVLHTINKMGYSTSDVEFIASSVSTWAPKICMIINALAIGMMSPLIPAISSAVARKDNDEVEAKINKAISLVVYVSLPLALGINILAEPIWGLFYNYNVYGPYILRVIAFSAVLGNVYLVLSTSLQSLSKYKLVYVISILGFVLNGLLDVPI
ncbi:MAG TPA: polysaccharide biosynthesis protein, partial [Bacilli bacterium]|nr:polysaccharide biosynthesis protein [Bacilli bacterium]